MMTIRVKITFYNERSGDWYGHDDDTHKNNTANDTSHSQKHEPSEMYMLAATLERVEAYRVALVADKSVFIVSS